ncbi:MAG: 50S ribosomal protein L23 [Patescibacteria group bacterium]
MNLFSKKTRIEEKKIVQSAPKAELVKVVPMKIGTGMGVKSVLKQPWFSERATVLATRGQYVFLVEPTATKPAVREEIERRYGVKVMSVNTVTIKGKTKHFGRKSSTQTGIKKAIITLKAGDKIEIQ